LLSGKAGLRRYPRVERILGLLKMRLWLSPERAQRYLVIILIFLTFIHLLTWYLNFYTSLEIFEVFRVFDFDEEANIPTLFNTFLLMICTGLLFLIGYGMLKQGLSGYRSWLALSAVFLVLTVDEFTGMHEGLVEPMRGLFHIEGGRLLPGLGDSRFRFRIIALAAVAQVAVGPAGPG